MPGNKMRVVGATERDKRPEMVIGLPAYETRRLWKHNRSDELQALWLASVANRSGWPIRPSLFASRDVPVSAFPIPLYGVSRRTARTGGIHHTALLSGAIGRCIRIVVPFPSMLSALMLPLCAATTFATRNRPNPDPSMLLALDPRRAFSKI